MDEETKGRKSKIVFEQGYQVVCQEPGKKGAIRGMVMENTIAEGNSLASNVIFLVNGIRNKLHMKHTIKKSERGVLSWANKTVKTLQNRE